MRRESRRRQVEDEMDTKKMLYITGSVLALAVIVFVITFLVYTNKLNSSEQQLGQLNNNSIGTIRAEETSTPYGRSVNEMQNMENTEEQNNQTDENSIEEKENNNTVEKTTKVAINTSSVAQKKSATSSKKEENKKEQTKTEETTNKTQEKVEEEKLPDPEFQMPVSGDIMKEFADSKLIYSSTLDVWTTHNGIDIQADKTTVVKASAEGTITSIKNDPRYGLTVTIEHVNGFKTVYANLLSTEFVHEGEEVKQGQSIGTIGNSGAFEISEEPHLHFELLKDNEQQDPELYLN